MFEKKLIPVLIVSLILLFVSHRHRLRNVITIIHGKMFSEENTDNKATSGVSGHVFTGEKTRTFSKRLQNPKMTPLNTIHICSKWAVVTTINAPTISIHKVVDQSNFCVVIVADHKTPTKEYFELESERVYFLSVEKQEKMQDMAITTELPWNHFGRKNLGYLYAIQHGAEIIFDFDDDNELISDIPFKTLEPWLVADETQVFNPYPMFVELEDVAWPRGFPLTQIQNVSTWKVPKFTTTNPSIGVIQSLANHDPDMDAIWRLTRKLPLNFDSNKRVVLPPGTYSSYNAQATIHYALWGTLLPVSVHGRVSDIWRSYIMQRLMHDVGQAVGFVSPFVKQVRNAHNYQADYMSERPLYEKTEALVRVLSEWKGKSAVFEERFVELFEELYERDFLEIKDVHLAQKWIRTLQQMKYKFPTLVRNPVLTIFKRVKKNTQLTVQPLSIQKKYELDYNNFFNPGLYSVKSNFGTYDGCANNKDIVLFLLWGHLRTFMMKLKNWHSFVKSVPCAYVMIYTRDIIEAPGKAWWGNRDSRGIYGKDDTPVALLETYVKNHANVGYHVVHQNSQITDNFIGSTNLAIAISRKHGIKLDNSTIIVQTRTDVLFSHTIDFERIKVKIKRFQNWLFFPRHRATLGGRDPQEMLLIGNYGWFKNKFNFKAMKKALEPGQCGACESLPVDFENDAVGMKKRKKCWERAIAYQFSHEHRQKQIHDAICDNLTPIFMNNILKIHLYRLNGNYATAIQQPGNILLVNPSQDIKLGPLDITKNAMEVIGRPELAGCFCKDRHIDITAHDNEISEFKKSKGAFTSKVSLHLNDWIWVRPLN